MPDYSRYVALGDSQTEGVGDGDDLTGLRGWADRLAEHLAAANPGLTYANLAVRGLRARQIRDTQLDIALALRPDVATVMAGMNDLIRPSYDAATVSTDLEAMFAALTGSGAVVATCTFPDIGVIAPVARPLRARVVDLNERILRLAQAYGVRVVRPDLHPVTTDPRIWAVDRLHASPLGHERIAAGMAQALGVPGFDDAWTTALPPLGRPPVLSRAINESRWLATFLAPWVARRVRGRSSADGRMAKRPALLPMTGDRFVG
ncbi:SGNH/GDSL hydrolase family protein [Luteipulveratus sp. YIM 133132]|uniref:SGNH/GDSL hydrolase family protein n=1 Tax=Luteipulveratus flavus TaxID=3031728 RepID=UPI0023AE9E4D|nr:SGNH/GDSL hydrolase family protein [Luteipulveratus sp. YIM 133132]MDE9365422.1 SGNH/GDSL hydrolase family protein [Luteipulveratus sp. YIM 133132]